MLAPIAPHLDPFDPNNWVEQEYEYRIYLDNYGNNYAIVDEIDWLYFSQWCWCIKRSKHRLLTPKFYARRAVGTNENGGRIRTRTVYLHIEIMRRFNPTPPSILHWIVDHRNGKSLDCRRKNLRWATQSMNSRNLFGGCPYDLEELMETPRCLSL